MRIVKRRVTGLSSALVAAAMLLGLTATTSAAAPALDVQIDTVPSGGIPAGSSGQLKIAVFNTGDVSTTAPVDVDLTLPPGLEITAVTDETRQGVGSGTLIWSCTTAPDLLSLGCSGPGSSGPPDIAPGEETCERLGLTKGGPLNHDGFYKLACRIVVTVTPDPSFSAGDVLTPSAEACGGGAPACAQTSHPTEILPPEIFEITSFDGGAFDGAGATQTQAGSHPSAASTEAHISTGITPSGRSYVVEDLEDAVAELPPGLVGNPQALPSCSVATFYSSAGAGKSCADETQVGVLTLFAESSLVPGRSATYYAPIYNLEPPPGTAALLAFKVVGVPFYISAKVRSDGDYGITAGSFGAAPTVQTSGFRVTVWGVPAASSHDLERGKCINSFGHISGQSCPSPDADDPKAFFTLPTSCTGPVETRLTVTSWQDGEETSSFLSHGDGGPNDLIGNTGCAALEFDPTLEARPTTNVADSPTGLDFNLHLPQDNITDPDGLVTAHLKDTTVTLPPGMTVNPSGANGLGGCSSAQAGLLTPVGSTPVHFKDEPTGCPDDSKVGTVEIRTPILDHPVPGSVYVATPNDNPFGSLLAIYIAVDDPLSGTAATIAGEVHADPSTGRLTTTVTDNPQLPLEDVELHLKGGAHASLQTPPTCGTYQTTSELTPWSAPDSGPPATPSDTYQISQGPGGSCASSESAMPHSPSFDAGTVAPLAGHYSPFVLNLRREDGSQRISALGLEPPQGLLAKLAGTTRCSDAALAAAASRPGRQEKSSPSCPASSHVGTVVAAAGAGPAPYYASGEAYLTGPYKGAPISLAIVTPATAGPFDLGTIVVRTALHVSPVTAQIDAISDPVPHILQGIPLDVRSVQVKLDRPGFTLNPTSCEPSAVKGRLFSTLGQVASLQSRFQLAECTRLGFKPKMTMRLKGGSKRGGHPALTVTLKPRPGDANIASVSVALPRSEFLDQSHIGTVCTRVQWAQDACPAASVYGTVSVTTPLLDQPLAGNVYLRSSDNLLPDLVPDLRGPADLPIRFEAAGRTDSIKGGIRNTFDFVPDAPFTKLVVKLKGGSKGLLINSRDICQKTYRATVKYGAHNGLKLTDRPPLAIKCGAKGKKKHRPRRANRRAAR